MSEAAQTHLPCPACKSSDALTLYDDGHTYCFSCKKTTPCKQTACPPAGFEQPTNHLKLINLNDTKTTPLKARLITEKTCTKYNYCLSRYNGQIVQVATYLNDLREPIGQKLRFRDKKFITLGSISDRFYGQHLYSNGSKTLIITEGEIDALTVYQITNGKYAVVSLPQGASSAKKAFNKNLDWLNKFEQTILMFDMDDAGRSAVQAVQGLLPQGKLHIANLPFKDPNECLVKGCSDEVLKAIYNAKEYTPSNIINGNQLWEILKDNLSEDLGFSFPWNLPIKTMLGGLRRGELTLVTAGTGVGKTTFIRSLAHHLGITLNLKIGMLMLEENIKRTAKGLMSLTIGKRLGLNDNTITTAEYKKAYDQTLAKGNFIFYQHFGSIKSDSLLNQIRYMAVSAKADFIFLDHITIALSGLDILDERRATDVMMTNLRSLVEETGVGLIVVSHLKRIDGTAAEEGGTVSLSHLRGSHSLSQLSDTVLALERNQQDEDLKAKNTIKLRLLKNRFTGDTGICGYLTYDRQTDRLIEAIAPKKAQKKEDECPF